MQYKEREMRWNKRWRFITRHKKSPNSITGNPGRMKGGVVPLGVEPRTHGFSVHCSTTWAKAPSFFTNGRNRLYLVFESECKVTLFSSISRIFFQCLITINDIPVCLLAFPTYAHLIIYSTPWEWHPGVSLVECCLYGDMQTMKLRNKNHYVSIMIRIWLI